MIKGFMRGSLFIPRDQRRSGAGNDYQAGHRPDGLFWKGYRITFFQAVVGGQSQQLTKRLQWSGKAKMAVTVGAADV